MSKKWHDISAETGDPEDVPSCDDTSNYIVTAESSEGEIAVLVFDGEMIHECTHGTYKDNPRVIAWRELPKAFIPSQKYKHKVVISEAAPSDMALPFTVEVIVHVEVKPI